MVCTGQGLIASLHTKYILSDLDHELLFPTAYHTCKSTQPLARCKCVNEHRFWNLFTLLSVKHVHEQLCHWKFWSQKLHSRVSSFKSENQMFRESFMFSTFKWGVWVKLGANIGVVGKSIPAFLKADYWFTGLFCDIHTYGQTYITMALLRSPIIDGRACKNCAIFKHIINYTLILHQTNLDLMLRLTVLHYSIRLTHLA